MTIPEAQTPQDSESSTLLMRRSVLQGLHSINCAVAKAGAQDAASRSWHDSNSMELDAGKSTIYVSENAETASETTGLVSSSCSADPSPESSPTLPESSQGGGLKLSLLDRRKKRFALRPTIDCSLVSQEDKHSNPFANPGCQHISDRFELLGRSGEGSTGVVYRARERSTEKEVAVKVMRMDDEEQLQNARSEYNVLRAVEPHPNIIKPIDFLAYPMGAILVLEYFDGKRLDKATHDNPGGCLREDTARMLFGKLMSAVEHLHSRNIIHRDVKADNILVSMDFSDLRLVDFNTATCNAEGGALTMTGTVDYMPPEVLVGDSPHKGSDIWAAGLCLHLMIMGTLPLQRHLFSSNCDFGRALRSQWEDIIQGVHLEHVSRHARDVLQSCLVVDPSERPSAKDILASSWFCGVPDQMRAA
mmetsp:Transcript_92775/g.198928  ORF Transcript_92775/g.198928 Transcript_92775/m.198928 type:complete len:418 (-) Transcript_92775:34-1287(-)